VGSSAVCADAVASLSEASGDDDGGSGIGFGALVESPGVAGVVAGQVQFFFRACGDDHDGDLCLDLPRSFHELLEAAWRRDAAK